MKLSNKIQHAISLLILPFLILSCQAEKKDGYTEIKGIVLSENIKSIQLYKVVHGNLQEIATVIPEKNGSFGFLFQPSYKGFYVVGYGNIYSLQHKYKFYFEGNDYLNISLCDTSYTHIGENTKENKLLTEWYNYSYDIQAATTNDDSLADTTVFFRNIDEYILAATTWIKGKETGNQSFDNLMGITTYYDPVMYASVGIMKTNSENFGRLAHFQQVKPSAYMQDTGILALPFGHRSLFQLLYIESALDGISENDMADVGKMIKRIPNNTLKGVLLLEACVGVDDYMILDEYKKAYGQYLVEQWQKEQMDAYISRVSEFSQGVPAIDFTLPDSSGKYMSLSDYKGKLVLVDVWATWCGPCKKEIPALIALEKKYYGKDLVFLGVSIDDKMDVWKNFLKTNHLPGMQLFAGGTNSAIYKIYKINGIPCFMLFDKQGNIITVDAPKASEKALQDIIDKWL